MGTRAQICILGLKPYLIMWIRPRRSKRLDRPQNGGSHTEKGGRVSSEEVILLGWGERRSSKYLGNLGDLPGISSDKDELQARTERISIQKYLREKLLPPYSMHCNNFSSRIYVEKTVRDRAPDPLYECCWAKPTWMGGVVLLPLKMEVRLVIFSPLD